MTVFREPVVDKIFREFEDTSESSSQSIISLDAGEALGGQKIVTTDATGDAILADNTVITDSNRVLGFTKTSATLGSSVDIITQGELEDVSFSFTPDALIWLGITGLPTQTPPSSGIVVIMGQAITATKILIRIQQTIQKVS